MRGRNTLPERAFVLPNTLGWILNIVRPLNNRVKNYTDIQQISLVYVILTTVLFLFPPFLPVTGTNMSKFPDVVYYWQITWC